MRQCLLHNRAKCELKIQASIASGVGIGEKGDVEKKDVDAIAVDVAEHPSAALPSYERWRPHERQQRRQLHPLLLLSRHRPRQSRRPSIHILPFTFQLLHSSH